MIVYLIHAHKNIEQVNKLIDLLSKDASKIYINVDKKSSIDPEHIDRRARIVEQRTDIIWGGWSQVEATLNSLRAIENDQFTYSHVVLISGQDFPLFSPHEIEARLVPGTDYISSTEISDAGWACQSRYDKFHHGGISRIIRELFQLFNMVIRWVGYKRTMPQGLKAYGGSSWWNLTQTTVRCILKYVEENKSVINFFKTTRCPDEIFFQTIINSIKIDANRENDSLRCIIFFEGRKNPEVLNLEHLTKVIASDAIFARKVERGKSSELTDEIMRIRKLQEGKEKAMPALQDRHGQTFTPPMGRGCYD